jgi:hypothetical protein
MRNDQGKFLPGNPGRKPGSKNKITELAKDAARLLLEKNTKLFVERVTDLMNDKSKAARIEGLKIFAGIIGKSLPSGVSLIDDDGNNVPSKITMNIVHTSPEEYKKALSEETKE